MQVFDKEKCHSSRYPINNNDEANNRNHFPLDAESLIIFFNSGNQKLPGFKRETVFRETCLSIGHVSPLRVSPFHFPARRFIPTRDRAATPSSPVHSIRRGITPFRCVVRVTGCVRTSGGSLEVVEGTVECFLSGQYRSGERECWPRLEVGVWDRSPTPFP